MNYPILIRALTLGTAVALVGCADRTDCAGALEAADAAATQRLPPGEWLPDVDAACSDAAMERWTRELANDCAAVFGFHTGMEGIEKPEQCAGSAFDSAYSLGEMVGEMRRELEEIEKRLQEESLPDDMRRDMARRQVVIGRDLPQIEALARMDGYLPPAEVPDSD